MRKKAIAVAAVKQTPLKLAMISAKNLFLDAVDFMYGTPKRARFTVGFAASLAMLGAGISVLANCCGCSH